MNAFSQFAVRTSQPNKSVNELGGIALFWLAAFSPSILHLVGGFSVASPVAALGPLLAGFGFAAGHRGVRLHFMALGTLVTMLLWAVNWLMMAGGCCKTLGQ